MGFKIDAVAQLRPIVRSGVMRHLQMNNLAEIIFHAIVRRPSVMQACR
jgi:hypothetical protein